MSYGRKNEPDTPAVNPALRLCTARGCSRQVPRKFLMCPRHWGMVPKQLQMAVWKHYRRGQEDDSEPLSYEYAQAANAAIEFVARKEGLL